MTKNKKYLITAAIITVIGMILFVIGGIMIDFDITAISSEKRTEVSHVIDEAFTSISINTTIADVRLTPSKDGICRVECLETARVSHKVSVVNGTLTVTLKDGRAWYEKIDIFFTKLMITVYLPAGEYDRLNVETDVGTVYAHSGFTFGSVSVECSTGTIFWESDVKGSATLETNTGRIRVSSVNLSDLKVSVDTGSVSITDVNADSINIESDTGGVTLSNTIITGRLNIEADTGDVKITDSDAEEAYIETDTGDVKGHFLTDMIFYAHSDTGKVRVPKSTVGGICEIESDTGDIIFE